MIEVEVEDLWVNLETQRRVLFLREIGGARCLPIWIGDFEAQAIAGKPKADPPPRPLAYNLIVLAIDRLDGMVERAAITDLQEDMFYAHLALR